jgi:hypothetical protein
MALEAVGVRVGYRSRGLSGILAGFLTIYFGIRCFYQFLVFRAESRCSEVSFRVGAGAAQLRTRQTVSPRNFYNLEKLTNLEKTYCFQFQI